MTCRRRALLVALLAAAAALRAQPVEIVELRHRSAEQLLPLLRPLLEPGGALSGHGFQLFLRASAANRRQLLDALAALDTAPRQLMVSVHQDEADERRRDQRAADGSLTIGTRGVDGTLDARADNSRRWSTQATTQRVRVLEGVSAYVAFGATVPMSFRQWVVTPQGLTEVRGAVLYETLTGFHALGQLAGDEVTLELAPEQPTTGAGGIEPSRLSTTVRGQLGEWIAVGGTDARSGSAHSAGSRQRAVWLKVDAVEPNR